MSAHSSGKSTSGSNCVKFERETGKSPIFRVVDLTVVVKVSKWRKNDCYHVYMYVLQSKVPVILGALSGGGDPP